MPQALSPVSGNRQATVAAAPSKTATAAASTAAANDKYAPPPPAELSDGTRTYDVGAKLGRGGFAICYDAKVRGTGECVALKVVKTQMARKVEEKFRTELQIHSKLRHRHIAEFQRAFTRDERTFIVVELCSRGTLKEMLAHRKHLSSPEVRRFGIQILGALSYMHSRSIVHRDLKMANIFLDGNMEPKIGDFGLAAVLLSDDQMGVIRRTTLCGTPNYIAPEVLSKSQGHDTKADIWSFGVLVYTLLVGTTPFSRPGDQHNNDVFARVKDTDYSWPDHCQGRVPWEARALVKDCLQSIELRPGAEALVSQSYFSMSGGIPPSLDRSTYREAPAFLMKRAPFEMRPSSQKVSLEALCELCGLGSVRSIDHGKSVYHEFLEEEAEKRTPILPLASVYTAQMPKFSKKPVRRQPGNIQRARSRPNLIATNSATQVTRATTRSASATVINHDTIRRPPPPEIHADVEAASAVSFVRSEEPFQIVRESSGIKEVESLTTLANTLSAFLRADESTVIDWPTESPLLPSLVERWCNYSNKYGIGYTLADGTIGCFFIHPSQGYRGVVVPDAVRHYHHRGMSKEILPQNGSDVVFVERQGKAKPAPLRAVVEFASSFAPDAAGKLPALPNLTPEANERREAMHLWGRFANYMTTKLGSDAPIAAPLNTPAPPALYNSSSSSTQPEATFPIAYQRFGNVNAWAHTSHALQFDFPDHTKLLLSPSGQHLSFWHLEPSLAASLHGSSSNSGDTHSDDHSPSGVPLPPSPTTLKSYRACVRGPTRLFFAGAADENRVLKQLGAAHELREKLGFVKDVVRMWARQGGVGRQGPDRLIWGGMGAEWGGDAGGRRTAWMGVGL